MQTTRRTTGLGTAPYIAPETLRGSDADARADVYGLGLILYEMLAGRHPWWDAFRNTAEMVRRQLFVEPEPLSAVAGLPAYVDDFMQRAICKDPAARFVSMGEMVKAMETLRDRLRTDAAAGLLPMVEVLGEPSICDDPRGERAYQPPVPVPQVPAPPQAPDARVVVPASVPGSGPKGTQRLPALGPKGTLPLGGTLPLRAAPSVPAPPRPRRRPRWIGALRRSPPRRARPAPGRPARARGSPRSRWSSRSSRASRS